MRRFLKPAGKYAANATMTVKSAGRSSSSPAWAWSPRSARARQTIGRKLTAGESGIRTITRFSTDGLKTRWPERSISSRSKPFSSPDLSRTTGELATEEAVGQSGIGTKGDFPGPLFLAVAPVEVEWPQRQEVGTGHPATRPTSTMTSAAGQRRRPLHAATTRRFLFGSVADHLGRDIRHQGIANFAVHGLRFGRHRDPARRRGDPPRRNRRRAVRRDRRLGQSGGPGAVFAAVGAVDPQRSPRRASKPFSKNRDGFVMAEGAGALVLESLEAAHRPRRENSRRGGRLRRTRRLFPSHPLQPGRQADHRLRAQRAGRCRHGLRADRLHQRARHRHARKRQDGISRHLRGVRRARPKRMPVSSNKSMVGHTLSAAGAVEAVFSLLDAGAPADSADHQLRQFRIPQFPSTSCLTRPAMRASPP